MPIQEFDFSTGKVLDPQRRQGILCVADDADESAIIDALRAKSFKLAGKTTDIREALALVKKHKVGVLFLDADMESYNALDIMATVRKAFSEIHVVLLSGNATKEVVAEALSSGAAGFVLKPVATEAVANILARIK